MRQTMNKSNRVAQAKRMIAVLLMAVADAVAQNQNAPTPQRQVLVSIPDRKLALIDDGQAAVRHNVRLLPDYRLTWGGEYDQFVAAKRQFNVIGPIALLLIFFILFAR